MSISGITRASSEKVWMSWVKAHDLNGNGELQSGAQGKMKKIPYRILDVIPGRSFSILWKTLFVRLIFIHAVTPLPKGSQITYDLRIEGWFAFPVRFFLERKIRDNLSHVLKTLIKQLEIG